MTLAFLGPDIDAALASDAFKLLAVAFVAVALFSAILELWERWLERRRDE